MTTVITAGGGDPPEPPGQALDLAQTVGEHEAKLERHAADIEEALSTARLAKDLSESSLTAYASSGHGHGDEYMSRVEAEERFADLAGRIAESAVPPPPPAPPAPPAADEPPKSREKRVRRSSWADKYYGGAA